MLRKTLVRARWSLIIPLLLVAPVTVPVTAQAAQAAQDAAQAYVSYLETLEQEGRCPAGTQREGCE